MSPALIVASAFAAFALIHSITVSRRFKSAAARTVGGRWMRAYYRLTFTVLSATITALFVYIYATQPDVFLYRPGPYALWACHAVQFLGIWLIVAAMRPFDTGYFTGIKQATGYLATGRSAGDIEGVEPVPLVTTGAYGLVRHPMYVAGIMMLVFEPNLTVNCIVVRVMGTAYFIWGGFIEERRFAEGFGQGYDGYRRAVPMFNIIAGLIRRARG